MYSLIGQKDELRPKMYRTFSHRPSAAERAQATKGVLAKLAAGDRDVVLAVGDGAFVFGAPTAAFWAARRYKLPFLTVIYNNPKDPAAFESYYSATHLPLVVQGAGEIAFTRAELTKYSKNLDGSAPSLYRQAKLYFPNAAALKKGTGTAAFKAVGDDLPKFADGGLVTLVGHLTSK